MCCETDGRQPLKRGRAMLIGAAVVGPPMLAVLATTIQGPAAPRPATVQSAVAGRAWARAEAADRDRRPPHQRLRGCRVPGPAGWLGPRAFGLDARPIGGVCRRPRPPGDLTATYSSVLYERCESRRRPGTCSIGLEVQTWPACERFPRRFIGGPGQGPLPYRRAAAAGRLVALYDGGHRADVLSGPVTFSIFSDRPELVLRAARRLTARQAGRKLSTNVLPGALSGRLRCSYRTSER
jgi:hypothetical protein